MEASRNQETWKEFKRLRNVVRKLSRDVVQNENLTVAKACKENPKKFWKHVKSKTSTYGTIGNIKQIDNSRNTITTYEDAEKANAFADYFSQVFTCESNEAFEKLQNYDIS